MSKKKKKNFRPTFRRGRKVNAGHPVYLYAKTKNGYEYIGLTHSDITDGTRNIKLEHNPNPDDQRTAYIRPKTGVSNEKFQTSYPNWSFHKDDKGKVKRVIKDNKKPKK